MEVSDKYLKYSLFVLIGLMLVMAIGGAIAKYRSDAEMTRLRNEVAARDHTIEIQENVYSKLVLETDVLEALLASKEVEVRALLAQVEKNNEDLLAANKLVIKWKKAYEAKGSGTQTETEEPGTGIVRKRVDFKKDFGLIGVTGHTLTDPPEYSLKVEQLKPLLITVLVTVDPDGSWRSYATTNDSNTAIDIDVSVVNPKLLDPKWYERFQVSTYLAGGQAGLGFGALVGLGVSYKINQFDIGPAAFLTVSDRIDKYVGASFSWRPFER